MFSSKPWLKMEIYSRKVIFFFYSSLFFLPIFSTASSLTTTTDYVTKTVEFFSTNDDYALHLKHGGAVRQFMPIEGKWSPFSSCVFYFVSYLFNFLPLKASKINPLFYGKCQVWERLAKLWYSRSAN